MFLALRSQLARPQRAPAELGALAGLYVLYELCRGAGSASLSLARAHTADVVSLERGLHLFHERGVQDWAQGLPILPVALGLAYMTMHLAMTALAMRWVYRTRRDAFPVVRTTLVVATAMSLAIYVLYPAAPPRLAGIGFSDTVSARTHLNLSSNLLGSFYDPLAAVPSLHFGYALLVGAAIASLARRRWARLAGALYPAFMLFDIVATGNHFLFDAVAGGTVVAAAWCVALLLVKPARPRTAVVRLPAPAHAC